MFTEGPVNITSYDAITYGYAENATNQTEASTVMADLIPVWRTWTYADILYFRFLSDMRLIICAVALFANVLVLLMQIRIKSFLKTHFIFAFTLTIAEIMYCVATVLEAWSYQQNIRPIPVIYGILTLGSNFQTYVSINAVAIDRYLALCVIPLKYKYIITVKKYLITVVLMFIFDAAYAIALYLIDNDPASSVHAIGTFIVPTAQISLTVTIYVLVCVSLHKSYSKIALSSEIKLRRVRQTQKIMLAFIAILATNIACLLPQRIFGLYIFLQPPGKKYELVQNIVYANWFYNLQTFNSILNPLIYWRQVLIKEPALSCFGRCKTDSKAIGKNAAPNISSAVSKPVPTSAVNNSTANDKAV